MKRWWIAGLVLTTLVAGAPAAWPADDAGCCQAAEGGSGAMACCAKHGQADAAGCCSTGDHAVERESATAEGAGMHGPGMRGLMRDAMTLLHNNDKLTRSTVDIENGVRTISRTSDPDLLNVLQRHPRAMYKHYEQGGAVRRRDPLFRELARVSDRVHMSFRDLKDGIEVTVTGDDEESVSLVRKHAEKVTEFVTRGPAAMHEGGEGRRGRHE